MSDKVTKVFLRIVGSQFNKRHESLDDEKLWVKSMVQGLGHYDAKVLERAAYRIINTRKEPGFPKLAECHEACDYIIKTDRASEAPKFLGVSEETRAKFASSFDSAYAHADWLIMQSPMGKQAANEGWVLTLHDFIRENGRLPKDYEITKCKATAKGFDEDYAKCLRGEAGPLSKPLAGLAEAMLKRRYKLTDMVLHGVVK